MKILIFRISKGEPGGVVEASCPVHFNKRRAELEDKLNAIVPDKIDYENNGYKDYLDEQLWKCNKLRQGWGIPKLDLRGNEEEWIENYILGARKYWDIPLHIFKNDDMCHDAAGRFKMFTETMNDVDLGDIVIIPTHSDKQHHDSKHFTIATVNGKYFFDLNEKYNDFGHVLPIKNLKVVPYDTLIKAIDFTGYYQRAVTEVKSHYKLHQPLLDFLKKNYLN
ncbi:MAG: hypothetical protein PHQ22_09980 [Sulfuricurvum sp.]|nr:hypothetical protein [Sulfuricurvum sp.]MDD5387507.1 hypothetical protein [Sulfuricurvum sp.]